MTNIKYTDTNIGYTQADMPHKEGIIGVRVEILLSQLGFAGQLHTAECIKKYWLCIT